MSDLRSAILRHRGVVALLVAIALLTRILVPAGFMPSAATDGTIAVRVCSGQMAEPAIMKIALPGIPAKPDHGQQKSDMPCPFAGLATAVLAGVDPALLVLALAFVLSRAFRPISACCPTQPSRLRPPLRGPPATL